MCSAASSAHYSSEDGDDMEDLSDYEYSDGDSCSVLPTKAEDEYEVSKR
jgi:hypothetical protein